MKVFDLNNINIQENNIDVWVDTNVLLWYFYYPTVNCSFNNAPKSKIQAYSNAFKNFSQNKCKIHTTIYNISEIIIFIEKNEYENFLIKNKKQKSKYHFKKFKKINKIDLYNKINNVLLQIRCLLNISDVSINWKNIDDYFKIYKNTTMGLFDYILSSEITTILITDDSDFIFSLPSIDLYTANRKIIDYAKSKKILHIT